MTRPAVLSAVGGAALWGTIGPVASLFTDQERLASSGIRIAIGACTLFALGGRPFTRAWRRRDIAPLLAAAIGLAGFQLCYFAAVGVSGVAISTAVSIGLAPVLTGLWTAVAGRGRPTGWWFAGTALAVSGLALLMLGGTAGIILSPKGLALSTVAAACFSLQAVSIRHLADRHADTVVLTAMFAIATLVLTPVTIAYASPSLLTGKALVSLLYLGTITAGVSYWLFAYGIRHLGAPAAITISLLEPACAAAIAALLLGERMTGGQWTGIGLICGAIVLTTISSTSPEPAAVPIRHRAPVTHRPDATTPHTITAPPHQGDPA
ncbi:EamA family transporter [Umezawaea sp. Da 62-37]|uniref:EamA family transporter n=1 Tax=Umezawaea sp. Da 62-37 TaxID=3075927 RepID=UPI0028F711B8|nr:EamA family transporter [Umezawaea sp. Da 62-37]WNV84004.1 EamA family transporter [Umezawaea sp. Da 62-37]